MKLKILSALLSAISFDFVYAGFNRFTIHSRASCGNNESISWDWTHDWLLHTFSQHSKYRDGRGYEPQHSIDTKREMTWRSAAVHWGEGVGSWKVVGDHFRHYTDGTWHEEGITNVTDCSIYDGW